MINYKKMSLVIMISLLTSCTSPKDAKKALESMGYTDIKMTGYSFFACADEDFYHTGFKAQNANGKTVEGVVCSGIFFKNSYVRFK